MLETEVPCCGSLNHVKDKTTSPFSTTKTSYLFTSRPHIHAHTYVQYWYEDWPQTYLNFIFIIAAMLRYASDSRELCKKAWHRPVVRRREWYTYSVEDFPRAYNLFLLINVFRIKGNENRKQIQPICLQMASNRVTMLWDCPLFLTDFVQRWPLKMKPTNLHSQTRLNTQNKEIKFPLK